MPDDVADGAVTAAPGPKGRVRRLARWIWRSAIQLAVRVYALALVAVISYLTYRSINYLITALVVPSQAPPQVRSIPRRLDSELLHGHRRDWLGLSAVEAARTPPSHYHRMDTWIAADPSNNCTQSGCHSPLPHAENKSTRAFLNMHATSLHCGVCHMESEEQPLDLTWYALADGRQAAAPAVLRAYDWLSRHTTPEARRACDRAARDQIADLLRQAGEGADGDPALLRISDHIRASRPGREEFSRMLDVATDAVVRSFRGAYGVKLALADSRGGPVLAHPDTAEKVTRFLSRPPKPDTQEYADQLAAIHPMRRAVPRNCVACHSPNAGLIPFEDLGYPPARAAMLRGGAIFPMIEKIGSGEPFQYPTFVAPRPEPQ